MYCIPVGENEFTVEHLFGEVNKFSSYHIKTYAVKPSDVPSGPAFFYIIFSHIFFQAQNLA